MVNLYFSKTGCSESSWARAGRAEEASPAALPTSRKPPASQSTKASGWARSARRPLREGAGFRREDWWWIRRSPSPDPTRELDWTGPSLAAYEDEDARSTLCFQERARLEARSPQTILVLQKCLLPSLSQ